AIMVINTRDDFDVAIDDLRPRGLLRSLRPYVLFARLLATRDVFMCFFDGGFLSSTPLGALELLLLRLARRRVIVMPYGSDVAVPGTLGPFEGPVFETYPALRAEAHETTRRVDRFCRYADLVVANLQPCYL